MNHYTRAGITGDVLTWVIVLFEGGAAGLRRGDHVERVEAKGVGCSGHHVVGDLRSGLIEGREERWSS